MLNMTLELLKEQISDAYLHKGAIERERRSLEDTSGIYANKLRDIEINYGNLITSLEAAKPCVP
jgi:hypothetical protein